MLDPSAYLANLGSDLTGGVLKALRGRAEEFTLGTPKYQALKRCYAAAELALLPPDAPHFTAYHPLLQGFLAEPEVAQEMAKLVKGRSPDVAALVEVFEDLTHSMELPDLDIELRLQAALEAFLQQAEQESTLHGDIQTAQLRDLVTAVTALPAEMAAAIEQMLQRLQPGSGDITFEKEATVHGDIITGLKIEVNPPPAPPPDPCLALGRRYLQGLMLKVTELPLAALGKEGASAKPVTLEQVYINLNTDQAVKLTATEKKQAQYRNRDDRPLAALEAAAQNDRLALLGAPGSGKSVFVNHLAYLLAHTRLNGGDLPGDWPGPPQWPVRFILREMAARLDVVTLNPLPEDQQNRLLLKLARTYLQEQWHTLGLSPEEAEVWGNCLRDRPCLLIFDGLDEVPPEQLPWMQRFIKLLAGHYPGRAIVTCRSRSYEGAARLPDFTATALARFTPEQRDRFVELWYIARPGLTEADRQSRIVSLRRAVHDLPTDLTTNPLLLTTLALIHTTGTELPKKRAELYKRGVEVLLHYWQRSRYGQASLLEALAIEPDRLLTALRQLAYQAHTVAAPGQTADLLHDVVVGELDRNIFGNAETAKLFLTYVDRQAGLLVGDGGTPPIYRFVHRTFQEYLAGCYLAAHRDGLEQAIPPLLQQSERWYLAAQLAAEEMLFNDVKPGPVLNLLYRLCPPTEPHSEAGWRGAAWAGVLAVATGPERIRQDKTPDCNLGQDFLNRLLPRLKTIVAEGMLTVAERADAGDALASLNGDDRPGLAVLLPPAGERAGEGGIPHHQFCAVPPGPFWLGSIKGEDNLADDDEYGHTEPFDLEYPYFISRYPVTQKQYHAFVQATGHPVPQRDEDWAQPYNWRDDAPPPQRRNHPVVLVSWRDAAAYCDWLNKVIASAAKQSPRSGAETASPAPRSDMLQTWPELQALIAGGQWSIRLPAEAEWEKAARGGLEIPVEPSILTIGAAGRLPSSPAMKTNPHPKRRWPWGEWAEDSPSHCANVWESQRRETMTTGSFPGGDSPYGCRDMAGNVWEWTDSQFRQYPYRNDNGRRKTDRTNVSMTLRGGAWSDNLWYARVSSRNGFHPDYFYDLLGFRVVIAPIF